MMLTSFSSCFFIHSCSTCWYCTQGAEPPHHHQPRKDPQTCLVAHILKTFFSLEVPFFAGDANLCLAYKKPTGIMGSRLSSGFHEQEATQGPGLAGAASVLHVFIPFLRYSAWELWGCGYSLWFSWWLLICFKFKNKDYVYSVKKRVKMCLF